MEGQSIMWQLTRTHRSTGLGQLESRASENHWNARCLGQRSVTPHAMWCCTAPLVAPKTLDMARPGTACTEKSSVPFRRRQLLKVCRKSMVHGSWLCLWVVWLCLSDLTCSWLWCEKEISHRCFVGLLGPRCTSATISWDQCHWAGCGTGAEFQDPELKKQYT